MKINLATPVVQTDSIVDGEGIRSVIWTQGCRHHCAGCHNPFTHSFDGGTFLEVEDVKKQIDLLENQDGITFSGGDPMEQALACLEIAKYAKEKGFNIWCYTGYTYEELLVKGKDDKSILNFLKCIDVLVDGRFEFMNKSYDAVFRGSTNQRLIDVPRSLAMGRVVVVTKYDTILINNKGRNNRYLYV